MRAADIFALLDHLGVERAKAIGLSMGAKTLLHMATQQPDRVDAMVLVSATPYFPAQARAAMAQLSVESLLGRRRGRRIGSATCTATIRSGCCSIRCAASRISHDDMAFTPPLLGTITARTLIVHGDRDPLYPVELALEMYRVDSRRLRCGSCPTAATGRSSGRRPRRSPRPRLAFLRGR